MKTIRIFFLITVALFANTVHSQSEPVESEQITQLIITLAKLSDMAEACGEHMNYFGKKALDGAVCKEFKQAFFDHWSSRKALEREVIDHADRLESGQLICERCALMLERIDELRVTVTYHLDYMDFIAEF